MPWIVAKDDQRAVLGLVCNYWFGFNVYNPNTGLYDFTNREPFTKLEFEWMTTIIQTNQIYIYWHRGADTKKFQVLIQDARKAWVAEILRNSHGIASAVTNITHFTLTATPGTYRMPEITFDEWDRGPIRHKENNFNICTLTHENIPQPPILLERLRTGAVSIIVDPDQTFVKERCIVNVPEFPITSNTADMYRCITLSKYMGIHVEIWLNLHNYQKKYRNKLKEMVFITEDLPLFENHQKLQLTGKMDVCKSCKVHTWWQAYLVQDIPELYSIYCVVCVHYTKMREMPCGIIPGFYTLDDQLHRLTHPVDTPKFLQIMLTLRAEKPNWIRTLDEASQPVYTYKNLVLATHLSSLEVYKKDPTKITNGVYILH